MRKMLFAAAAATMFVVAPALANPSQEAEEDYAGWKAAREGNAKQQVETLKGHVIYQSNPAGR